MTEHTVVVISSTVLDLDEHRAEIRAACESLDFFPKMMESLPALDADAIKASLDLVDEAEVYLGVFAYRYGYIPKGNDTSITEMEYRRAVESGIPKLIFLIHKDHPVTGPDFDPEGFDKLTALKEELSTDNVVAYFRSPEDLRAKVIQALVKLREDQRAHLGPAGDGVGAHRPSQPPTGELVPRAYLARLKSEVARVELLGLDLKESIPNGLPQVYVPAVTPTVRAAEPEEAGYRGQRQDLVMQRLGDGSLYVPGDPGSGKSTFCEWVAYTVANGAVPAHEIAPPDELRETLPESLAGRLPVMVRLRDFWGRMDCLANPGDWSQPQLENALCDWVQATRPYGLGRDVFERNLAAGNLLLLIDGVDEVPEENLQAGKTVFLRQALISGLAAALPSWLQAHHRVLVTSRPYGLRAADRDRLRLPEATLLGLDDELQRLFTARWYAAADHAKWREYAEGISTEMAHRRELDELRRNPLLLTALCVKYKEGKRLPHDVYSLYNSVVNQVLFNRFRSSDRERTRVRWRLEAVALGMHYGLDDESVRPTPLASVGLDELDRILANYAEQNPSTEGGAAEVLERREELLERSGVFLPRGEDRAEFYHQDFRDYLAAERWAREGRSLKTVLGDFGHDRNWRRMLGFLFAKVIEDSGGIDRPLGALAALEPKLDRESLQTDAAAALLVADCLEIAAGKARQQGLPETWVQRLRQVCTDALETVGTAVDRNALLLALGRLGWDDRPGIALDEQGLPDIVWLPVPEAGNPVYYIARYPVTQAQFQAFAEADDGHGDLRWWQGFENRREEPSRPTWPEPNAPRTDIGWFEAIAFCRWLTHHGVVAKDGWEVSLPTDAEWLRAYVAQESMDFPWQGETDPQRHANYDESGLDRTSSVGMFPLGKAATGAFDMAGNVEEWCLDNYDKPGETSIDDSSDSRVLRGGSWDDSRVILRSGFRYWFNPGARFFNVGFRLFCRPPSSAGR